MRCDGLGARMCVGVMVLGLSVPGLAAAESGDVPAAAKAPAKEKQAGRGIALPSLPEPRPVEEERWRPHRSAMAVGWILLATGAAFGLAAHDSRVSAVAQPHARAARLGFGSSRQSAALANVALAAGGVAVAYGIVVELVAPPEAARYLRLQGEF